VDGEPVIWKNTPPEFKGLLGFLQDLFSGKGSSTINVITGKRALILEVNENQRKVLSQCNLAQCTASVINRRRYHGNISGTGANVSVQNIPQLGDLVFFRNGNVVLKFSDVNDPDYLLELVRSAVISRTSDRVSTDQNKPLNLPGPSPSRAALYQQGARKEAGPLTEFVLGYGERILWEWTKLRSYRCIITNKRAVTITTKPSFSGFMERALGNFGTNDSPQISEVNLLDAQIIAKKTGEMTKEHLDYYASKSYLDSVIALNKASYKNAPNVRDQTMVPVGDIIFLVNGHIALQFKEIPDPESVVSLVQAVLKQSV